MKKVDQFRFRILDNSPEGVILLDGGLQIVYINKMIEDWTGQTLEKIEGRRIIDVFPHMAKPAYKNRFKQVWETRFPMILSSQLHPHFIPTDPTRAHRVGQTTLSSVDETDTSPRLLRVSLMDMTATTAQYYKILELQKISQNEIIKREKAQIALLKERGELQSANAAKDKFFSILAHDLRGPLGGLVSMSETMLDDFDMFDKTDLKEIIGIMHHSSSQIFGLLQNLLTWSRMNTGGIQYEPETIDLRSVVDNVLVLFEGQASKKEQKLIVSCANEAEVYADRPMLETVLRNLVSNALKFTPRGGQVTIRSDTDEANNTTTLAVSDTGVGMTVEVQEQLFEITSTYHTPGTENEASSGLGLVLVNEFVQRNGGRVFIESERGVGSTFRCTFHAHPDKADNF